MAVFMISLPALGGILNTSDEPVSRYGSFMVLTFLSGESLYTYGVWRMHFNYTHLPTISSITNNHRFLQSSSDTSQRIDNQGSLSLNGLVSS